MGKAREQELRVTALGMIALVLLAALLTVSTAVALRREAPRVAAGHVGEPGRRRGFRSVHPALTLARAGSAGA